MRNFVFCIVSLAILAAVSAHYEGYPFKHVNGGRYGLAYPYANYYVPVPVRAAVVPAPVEESVETVEIESESSEMEEPVVMEESMEEKEVEMETAHEEQEEQQVVGFGFNHEFSYRGFGGTPVHLGGGAFYYLGTFNGNCVHGVRGIYYTGDPTSFMVCDHGQAHKFDCAAGTQNPPISEFRQYQAYGMNHLCSVNTLSH